jgi:hypothetical protein
MSFHQGTWLFMAADLVESPGTRQTFVHDLESFFWVLLWIVLTQVPCNWEIGRRSRFISETMSLKVYGETGGEAKKIYLRAKENLSEGDIEIPNNTTLRELLKGFMDSVGARHCLPPSKPNPIDPAIITGQKNINDKVDSAYQEYKRGLDYLKDHSLVLRQFEMALDADLRLWPSDDKAVFQQFVPSRSMSWVSNSGSKRARSVAEENGAFTVQSSSKRQG